MTDPELCLHCWHPVVRVEPHAVEVCCWCGVERDHGTEHLPKDVVDQIAEIRK